VLLDKLVPPVQLVLGQRVQRDKLVQPEQLELLVLLDKLVPPEQLELLVLLDKLVQLALLALE
jgi:hypothetical protein